MTEKYTINENLSNEIGQNTEKDLEIWESIGLLEGLEGEKKQQCSELFTKVSKFFLDNPSKQKDVVLEPSVILYPIMRELVRQDEVDPKYIDFDGAIKTLTEWWEIDVEANLVEIYCQHFINKAKEKAEKQ